MVLGRMGLLDDAIREHLELKRLKGADPGDVARDEQEALGEDGPPEQARAGAHEEPYEDAQAEPVGPDEQLHGHAIEQPGPAAHATAGRETIELDMESVLASRSRSAAEQTYSGDADAAVPHPADSTDAEGSDLEDSLEWEIPVEQEPNESGDAPEGNSEDEPVEDVLEETPDFLRETPEQERLWFEQRPPRDFDFNE
jgi:hypothetical protein